MLILVGLVDRQKVNELHHAPILFIGVNRARQLKLAQFQIGLG